MFTQTAIMDFIAQACIMLPAALIAFSIHEFCHALVATLCGDDTPYHQGRLTLNPVAHIDPIGLICALTLGFGWAKPVIFNPFNFKHRRVYSSLTAIAGPLSNVFLALIFMYTLKYFPYASLSPAGAKTAYQIMQANIGFNIMLAVFNILPIPPLDGSHVLTAILERPFPDFVRIMHEYSLFILLGFLLFPGTNHLLHRGIITLWDFLQKLVI